MTPAPSPPTARRDTDLRHHAFVDFGAGNSRPLCQPGDGAASAPVTGAGHARLIFERFGKFWGAFSVIDLFPTKRALIIVTEFIGISLALDYLGLNKVVGVVVTAGLIMAAVSTGNFRRFERFSMVLVFGSLLLPIFFPRPSAARAGRARLRRSANPIDRQDERFDAARHRTRRHYGCAVAALLSAELCDRQAHHAPFHPL